MATKVASLYADVSANTGGFMAGMGTVKSTLSSAASGLTAFAGLAAGAFTAAAIGAIAFKKALDFGEEGAAILQTRDSFNSLATSLGQGPGLLRELQTATRGTVTELDLMRSTATLLMGTSGELGQQLAENAPQLARIAQAAHDLNPTMGTTAEMYDRLSRGIKKAEPELLDEVGILMNLTQVYKEYAREHGITVTAMDKTMKTEAMLNAVLKQGNTLIEQAGSVSNSAATSIDRLQAELEDAGNAAKELFAPGIASAADAIYYLLNGAELVRDALAAHSKDVYASAKSYDEYREELWRAAEAAGYVIDSMGNLRTSYGRMIQQNYMMTESQYNLNKEVEYTHKVHRELTPAIDEATAAVGASEQAIQTYSDRLSGLAGYYGGLIEAENNRIVSAGLMAGIQGTLNDATESYNASLATLIEQETNIVAAMQEAAEAGYGPTSEKVRDLTQALSDNKAAQENALLALQQVTAEMMYQQAAAGLDAQSALDLARNMGVLSESDYAVAASVQAVREEFFDASGAYLKAGKSAEEYVMAQTAVNQAVENLQARNIEPTIEGIRSELERMAKAQAAAPLEDTGTAAGEAAPAMTDVATAAGDAAGTLTDAAGAADDTAAGLSDAAGAAGESVGKINSAGNAARSATGPLNAAAAAAGRLADNLSSIRSSTSIRVTYFGFDEAIRKANELTAALSRIPTSINITANLTETGATTTSSPGSSAPIHGVSTVVENYYIENPLAAAILAQNKRMATAQRLEELMNG